MPYVLLRRFLSAYSTAIVIAIAGCGGGDGGSGPSSVPVASVVVSPQTLDVYVSQTGTLTAQTKDANGGTLSGRSITWTSSAPSVATVANGVVTGVAPGGATITATSEGKSASAQVTVLAPVASITVTPPTSNLLVGATVSLSANLRDAAGNQLTGRTVSWSSGNSTIVSVSGTGVVTGVSPGGPVTVTATSEGVSGSAQVTTLAPVATVAVSPSTASVVAGGTTALTVTLRDASNNELTGRTVTWTSSNIAVATVSSSGVVSGVSVGSASVTATSEGKSGTSQVTVLPPVTSVVINGAARTKVGDNYTYSATAKLADGSVVTRPTTWSVVETQKATMTPAGLLTPQQTGTITVRATIDGVGWTAPTSAYDWQDLSSGGSLRVALESDTQISNWLGQSEYPLLVIACTSSGYFFLWISMDNFITDSGIIAYSFDANSPVGAVWDELSPDFNTLWHPGPSGSTKTFATTMAGARLFGFAFREFLSDIHAMAFRVTGLGPRLAPILAACPSNSPTDASLATGVLASERLEEVGVRLAPSLRAQERGRRGAGILSVPGLRLSVPVLESQPAVRDRQQ